MLDGVGESGVKRINGSEFRGMNGTNFEAVGNVNKVGDAKTGVEFIAGRRSLEGEGLRGWVVGVEDTRGGRRKREWA